MAPTLRLLAGLADPAPLDLSGYLRLGEDEGLDPADPDFLIPAFSESSVGDGSQLVSVDASNKELVWPLHLSAADVPALHALSATIRRKLNEPGLMLEWHTTGASAPTFWDLEFGRFDTEYRHWRATEGFMLSGSLRAWVRPYGHTATSRLVATGQANGALLEMMVGEVAGDVDAQAVITVGDDFPASATGGFTFVAACVAGASASLRLRPADMDDSTGVVVGASGAVASQALSQHATGAFGGYGLAFGQLDIERWPGPRRVLALARFNGATGTLRAQAGSYYNTAGKYVAGRELGKATLPNSNDWHVVDLGVAHFTPDQGATQSLVMLAAVEGAATMQITEMYLLPEDSTLGVVDAKTTEAYTATYGLDSITAAVSARRRLSNGVAVDGALEPRGNLATIDPGPPQKVACLLVDDGSVAQRDFTASVKVRERFSYLRA